MHIDEKRYFKRRYIMEGYIMNLYKSLIKRHNIESREEETDNGGKILYKSVVWSKFDRVKISKINTFDDYIKSGDMDKTWSGERQTALLYTLCDRSKKLKFKYKQYEEDSQKCRFMFFAKDNEAYDYLFFGISMINFSYEMFKTVYSKSVPHEFIYEQMNKVLDQIISRNQNLLSDGEHLKYEVLGVLGADDICIIWLSDQFQDIMTIMELFRNTKIYEEEEDNISTTNSMSMINNVYTIIGLYDSYTESEKKEEINEKFAKLKGKIEINLTRQNIGKIDDNESIEEKITKLLGIDSSESIEFVFGEHDIRMKFDASKLNVKSYGREGIHYSNESFYKYFLQADSTLIGTNVTDLENADYVEVELEGLSENIEKKADNLNVTQEIYHSMEEIEKLEVIQLYPYLKEVLWLLNSDYLKNVSSILTDPWTEDLKHQIKSAMKFFALYLSKYRTDEKRKNKIITNMDLFIDTVRQTMIHIGQANRMFYEIPNSYLKFTGAYSKILRMYYGVVKEYVEKAYMQLGKKNCKEMIPFIYFSIVPKVTSKTVRLSESDNFIININLPFEAFSSIDDYVKLLGHEIYHYFLYDKDCSYVKFECVEENFLEFKECYRDILENFGLMYTLVSNVKSFDVAKWKEHCRHYIWENQNIILMFCIEENEKRWGNLTNGKEIQRLKIRFESDKNSVFAYISRFLNYIQDNNIILKEEDIEGTYRDIHKEFRKLLNEKVIKEDDKELLYVNRLRNHECKNMKQLADTFKYALQEAKSDIFMCKMCGLKLEDYLTLYFKYWRLFLSDVWEMRQKLRVGMVVNYFLEEQDKYWGEESCDKIMDFLKEVTPLQNIDDIKKALNYYNDVGRIFNEVLKKIFDNICGNEISNPDLLIQNETDLNGTISFIEKWQNQKKLSDVYRLCKEKKVSSCDYMKALKRNISEFKNINSYDYMKGNYMFIAASVEQLCIVMTQAIESITDNQQNDIIWYRGHESMEYKLIPSIYRMGDGKTKTKYQTCEKPLEDLMNMFRVKSFHYDDIYENTSNLDCLISMQHYGVKTNMMDWSTDAFVALFFALEHVINNLGKYNSNKERIKYAQIFLLNPVRLNEIRDSVDNTNNIGTLYSPIEKEDDAKKYILEGNETRNKTAYPIAKNVKYVNKRIGDQRGTFVIFPVTNIGKMDKMDGSYDFSDYDLMKIQNDLLGKNSEKNSKSLIKPFICSIAIPATAFVGIARWLKNAGYNETRVYSELHKIGENIMKEYERNH